jgi:isoleucyl-tRNA synthetase
MLPLDFEILARARRLSRRLIEAYRDYDFHVVYHALLGFCAGDLSAFYLDVIKDRLYASAPASPERRSAQTALHRMARSLAALSAPVLPFTSEEVWQAVPGKKEESVHLARFDALDDVPENSRSEAAWERLTKLREEAAVILEEARRNKVIGSSLEGAIALSGAAALEADRAVTGTLGAGLADLLIVSEVLEDGGSEPGDGWRESQAYPGVRMAFRKARGRRCDRCWKVTPEAEGNGLCVRCRGVLEEVAA